jgi:cell division protease FtsH
VFLGRSVTQHKHVSEETARKIDEVVRGVIDNAYNRARTLLTTNIDKLHTMAKALLQYETIDGNQINAIMEGREPGAPKDWGKPSGSDSGGTPKADKPATPPLGGPAAQH